MRLECAGWELAIERARYVELPHSGLEFTMLAVQQPGRTIVPTLRYRDVAAAVDWLCTAFGFERHLAVPDENGAVRYAELTFGDGMIMLGPAQGSSFDGLLTQPVDAGGVETQICYLFVEDAVDHCAIAKAAGAEMVLDIEEDDGGARGYSCRDPEGHTWNVGTYNPWHRRLQSADPSYAQDRGANWGRRRVAMTAGLLVFMAGSALAVALGAVDWTSFGSQPAAATSMAADAPAKVEEMQVTRAREGRPADERAIEVLNEQLAKERAAKEAAERGTRAAREQLAHERQAKEAAESKAKAAGEQLTREKTNLETAERVVHEKDEQLAAERNRREAAERASKAREREAERAKQAARERKAMKERAAKEAQKRQMRQASHSQATAAGQALPLW